MSTVLGAWVPGLPLVLSHEKSPQWQALHEAYTLLGKRVAELKPDVLVVHSSQWLSVLGTSFQTQPNPKGLHVDENWYEWGDLPFNFRCDTALSESFAKAVAKPGFPTKTVNFEEFPIDTGTIVLMRYLNPEGKIPVSIVSTWVYADHEKATQIGTAMQGVIKTQNKKAVVVASSLLSTRYFTDEINPKEDKISDPKDNEWNLKILKCFEAGDFAQAAMLARDFVAAAPTDMQLNALHWLRGILAGETWKGKVLGYGPQWGTGAAIVEFGRG